MSRAGVKEAFSSAPAARDVRRRLLSHAEQKFISNVPRLEHYLELADIALGLRKPEPYGPKLRKKTDSGSQE